MNLLFLFDRPFITSNGGVERVTSLISEELIKKRYRIFYLSIDVPQKEIKSFSGDDSHFFIDSDDYNTFHEIVRSKKIDVIINHLLTSNAYKALKNLSSNSVKIISILHFQPFSIMGKERKYFSLLNPTTKKEFLLKYFALVFPYLFRHIKIKHNRENILKFIDISDKFVLLSDKFIPRLKKFIPNIDIKKIDAINNPNTFNSIQNDFEKENIVLFVGRMVDPQKNVKGFIDVWKEFNKKYPDWKGIILGEGPHKPLFENYAKVHKVKNLNFLGNVQDVSLYYAKAKCLCMTSVYEGWGMVLTEAVEYGCIPIAFDTYEALYDIIDDGNSGYIIPAFDTKKMVSALSKIADNDSLRYYMTNNGKKIIEKFNPKNISNVWDEKLKDIISN